MTPEDKVGKEAAHRYDEKAADYAKTDKGEKAAKEAERALDSGEARKLREAERRGRAPGRK